MRADFTYSYQTAQYLKQKKLENLGDILFISKHCSRLFTVNAVARHSQ